MATRAIIKGYGKQPETPTDSPGLMIYNHWDGYPRGLGFILVDILRETAERDIITNRSDISNIIKKRMEEVPKKNLPYTAYGINDFFALMITLLKTPFLKNGGGLYVLDPGSKESFADCDYEYIIYPEFNDGLFYDIVLEAYPNGLYNQLRKDIPIFQCRYTEIVGLPREIALNKIEKKMTYYEEMNTYAHN